MRRACGALLIALSLGPAAALAGEPARIRITAEVTPDLQGVHGVIAVEGLEDARWMDPLSTLPRPDHELDLLRTYPGAPDDGVVRWSPAPSGGRSFHTVLPRRLGDLGATRHGLFANGAWYPQPLTDGGLPLVAWTVCVTLPDGATGVVGDQVGEGEVCWEGEGERVSLAVLRDAVVTPVQSPAARITLVTPRRPRPGLVTDLRRESPLAMLEEQPLEVVVVQAPLRRRLARPGVGMAYVSDRANRVFPWFRRLHHPAVLGALHAAASPLADPFARGLVGAGASRRLLERVRRRQAVDLLGLTRWIPAVDAALYDREMPFQAEVFRRVHRTDRLADDLVERLDPSGPPAAALAQLADVHGEAVADELVGLLSLGWSLPEATARIGLPADTWIRWRQAYPRGQDHTLAVDDEVLSLRRDAPEDAPPEAVVVRIDGEDRVWETGPGSDRTTWILQTPPDRVVLDPSRHTMQRSRVGDVQPAPLRWTLSGQISGINVSEAFVNAFAVVSLRRADDTWNRWQVWAFTNQREWLRGRFTYTRFAGPLVRGATREHALRVSAEGAWLNRRFSPLGEADATVGGSLSYTWDNRVYSLFPTRGARVSVSVSGGGAPQTGQTYVRSIGTVVGLIPAHPRHVFAARLTGGGAVTDIPQRRLAFGGSAGFRGIPDDLVQTEAQGVVSVEYRWVPLRGASIPLALTYVEDLQLTFGVDAALGRSDDTTVSGIGVTAGAGVVVSNLGLSPAAATVTFGIPAATWGFDIPERTLPFELYIGWGQTF